VVLFLLSYYDNEGGDPMFEEVFNDVSMAIALVAMGIAFYLYYLPF
jgi:hypothetical protein